jgi:hypothetical protein
MTDTFHARPRLAALALAGVLFAAYPIVRPYSDETTMIGARAIASGAWIAAHTFAMLGFGLLALALPAATRLISAGRERLSSTGALLAAVGTGLVLPYYGAEAFGLHAIASQALASGDVSQMRLLDTVRYQPVAIASFGIGLVLLAAAGVTLAMSLWSTPAAHARRALRLGAVLLAAGLVTFLPQFFAPAPLRMAHGVVLAIGCILVAAGAWRWEPLAVRASTTPGNQLTGEPPVTPSISAVM